MSEKNLRMNKMKKSSSYRNRRYTLLDKKLKKFNWELSFGDIYLETQIGKGGYGFIHKGKWKNRQVAVKKLKGISVDSDVIHEFLKEISILSLANHENIVEFIGAYLGTTICLVTEYCEKGDLGFNLKNNELSWQAKIDFVIQIANGMNYLHSRDPPIVHRDLKCSNILVTEFNKIKLCDFGLSKHLILGASNTKLGTIAWTAPELIIDFNTPYTKSADIYSFGMVLWEVLHDGEVPYGDLQEIQTIRAIERGDKPPLPENVNEVYGTIIKDCWNDDPKTRPSFEQVLKTLGSL